MSDTKLMGYYITTFDNPYSPITQFDQWYTFDMQKGYNSCGLLARFYKGSDELPRSIKNELTRQAIQEIIELFPDIYKMIEEPCEEEYIHPKYYIDED